MTRFGVSLLVVGVAAWCVAWFGRWLNIAPVAAGVAEAILFVATLLVYALVTHASDPQRFTQMYLLSIVVKMLVTCVVIVVLILVDKNHARGNVLFLFVVYVLFTIVEVIFLMQFKRRIGEPKKNQNISF